MVVALTAILASIALPTYEDSTAVAQVSDGIILATSARVAIAGYYGNQR